MRFAWTFRGRLLAHPNAMPLLVRRRDTGYMIARGAAEAGMADLIADGLGRHEAVDITRLLVRYVFGAAMLEVAQRPVGPPPAAAGGAEFAALLRSMATEDPERLFATGLDVLLAGIRHTWMASAPSPAA